MLQSIRKSVRFRTRVRALLEGGPKAHRIPARWVRRLDVTPGTNLCIFVLLTRGGRILPHSVDHARAWHDAGFDVMMVVVVESLDPPIDEAPLDLAAIDFAKGILLRLNRGYDFGAWAAAIRSIMPQIGRCSTLAIANDSVVGPSSHFGAMLDRARQSDAALIGLVESHEVAPHFQSFTLFFKAEAVASRVFRRFWRSVRSGGRDYVIAHYEVPMRRRFEAAGLATHAIHPGHRHAPFNRTLSGWRELLAEGFPYLKIQLLRDAPDGASLDGWRHEAERHGFDLARLDQQIEALRVTSTWAL